MMEPKEIDTYGKDFIVCPHCGYVDHDSFEQSPDDGQTECAECERPFVYSRNISISYTTYKIGSR